MTITTFAQAEASLAESLPGYESRPQQQALARAIEQGLSTRQHVLAQAGCGTGKSLGSMIPAILHATSKGEKVVVATATIALQNQYADKDVPFLAEHLGVPFTFALLKGRANYACYAKLNDPKNRNPELVSRVMAELEGDEDHTGDRETFGFEITKQDFRDVSSSGDECPGKSDCPFGSICLAEAAKDRARRSQVVVVNYAMLATDLKVKAMLREVMDQAKADERSMIGAYDVVIMDEAHEIEEIVTEQLKERITERGIHNLASEAMTFAGATEWRDAVEDAVNRVNQAASAAWAILPEGIISTRFFLDHERTFTALSTSLRELAQEIERMHVNRDDKQAMAKQGRILNKAYAASYKIESIMLADENTMVRWGEHGKTGLDLNSAPLHIGGWLNEHLWSRATSILISATLAVGDDFSYLTSRLSVPNPITTDVGTPFDYDKQARLYIPANTPHPTKERTAWLTASAVQTLELIKASKGGALLLFTSREALESSHATLVRQIEALGYRVFKQGEGTNKAIADGFKNDEHSVLFALKSFFTGMDFQGDTCRLVVIDKMPFPVPTDVVFKARCEAFDRSKGRNGASFYGMSIPAMALTLLQGFGRLIRTKNDRGVVAILDSRLVTENYGRKIVQSLPDCQVVTDLAAVQEFFA